MGAWKAIWITAGTVFRGVELILGLGQTPGWPRPPPRLHLCTHTATYGAREASQPRGPALSSAETDLTVAMEQILFQLPDKIPAEDSQFSAITKASSFLWQLKTA